MRLTSTNKKGVMQSLSTLAIALVAVGIAVVIGMLIMVEVADKLETSEACNNASAYWNASSLKCTNSSSDSTASPEGVTNTTQGVIETVSAMGDIPTWLPIIVITVIGALLIGLVSLFRKS